MRIDPTPPAGRADRIALGAPATMRDPARSPIDVLVENLSETGALLRTDAALPVGSLVSLGLAGLGMQLARVVRTEPRAAAIGFMAPLEPQAVARAAAAPVLTAVAIPQILVQRLARTDTPATSAPTGEAPSPAAIARLPVMPMPVPAEAAALPTVYGAQGRIESAPVIDRPPPDARALWLAEAKPERPQGPGIGAWLLVGVLVLAALAYLLI